MRDSLRKTWLAGLWLALALAVPFAAPLTAQGPVEEWENEYNETGVVVTQWQPTESEMADLDPTFAGDVELEGDGGWTWFVALEASASQVLVAAPEDFEIPYEIGIDFDGYVQDDVLHMNFIEPGIYAVTIHFQDLEAQPKTFMVFAGAKQQKIRCDPRDPMVFGIRAYVPPAHDLYVVNSTSPDGYLDCARVALNGEINVNGWPALRAAINNTFTALGRPITVFALSHGDVSQQTPAPVFTIFNNNANVRTMTAAPAAGGRGGVQGRVSEYNTFSCCTGKDVNNPPAGGPHLLDALAGSLSVPGLVATASGWDRVTVCLPTGRRTASLYTVIGANQNVR